MLEAIHMALLPYGLMTIKSNEWMLNSSYGNQYLGSKLILRNTYFDNAFVVFTG